MTHSEQLFRHENSRQTEKGESYASYDFQRQLWSITCSTWTTGSNIQPICIDRITPGPNRNNGMCWRGTTVYGDRHWCYTVNNISEETWNQHWSTPRPCLKGIRDSLRTYTGQCVKITGIADVTVVAKTGSKHVLPLMVVPGNGPSLLGRNWLSTLQLDWSAIHHMNTTSSTQNPQLRALLKKHSAGFSDTHQAIKTNVAKIYADDNAVTKYFKARSLPYVMRDMVDKELDRLLAEDIIEPVQYSDWAAPVVPVMKADKMVRLCGDYKLTVNQVANMDRYPLPRIEDLYAQLGNGTTYTKLDMRHAYEQIELHPESRNYVTIYFIFYIPIYIFLVKEGRKEGRNIFIWQNDNVQYIFKIIE